nr:hypothetical protein [uncultured Oscillibacter sp.]
MRKLKKINGYLVVRFNDREKREYEGTGLGNFGVIDAELYTGILDVDRSVMEYDAAETLEIALEQARGLESELDVVEPEVKITVIIEGETEVSEEDVEPESLFKGQRATLETQLKHGPHLDLDPLTAAHELHGYAKALEDLGMIDGHDERFMVERDIFGATAPLPEQEEALAYICDEVCKYREGRTQEELDAICAKCKVDRWARASPAPTPRAERNRLGLLKEVSDYVNGKENTPPTGGVGAERDTFTNLDPSTNSKLMTRKVYALGKLLENDCPENDCRIYLNIFRMAKSLDTALDGFNASSYPAQVLRSDLRQHLRELRRMYHENHAVQQYKEGMKK